MVYVDYKQGGKESIWHRCDLKDLTNHVTNTDFHVTWQQYENDRAGQYGEVYGDWVFDFDHLLDLNIARMDCVKTYDLLTDMGVNPVNIRLYFSGNKGFHLLIDHRAYMSRPEFDLHLIYKQLYLHIESKIKPEKGKSTLDRQIYAIRKTIRYPNTKHPKSKLYKVPISLKELRSTVLEIKKLAEFPREIKYNFVKDLALCQFLKDAKTAYWKNIEEFDKRAILIDEYTGTYPPCVNRILAEGIPKGERNYYIYLLARFLKKTQTKTEVTRILSEYANRIGYDISATVSTINSAFNRSGAFLSCSEFYNFCEREKCNLFTKKESLDQFDRVSRKFNILTYQEAVNQYLTAKADGEFDRAITTGIDKLDALVEIWRDGFVVIGASANMGKTSLGITIAKNNPRKKGLYLAIEEGSKRTAKRFIEAELAQDTNIKVISAKMGEITPEDLSALCYCNPDAGFIIVDQMVNLNSIAKEERLKYKRIMEICRESARHYGIPHFFLHQLNREAARVNEPMKEHLAEGADIERLAYDIWLLYRKKVAGKVYNLIKIDKVKHGPCPVIVPVKYGFDSCTFENYDVDIPMSEAKILGLELGAYSKELVISPLETKQERLPLSYIEHTCPDWADED